MGFDFYIQLVLHMDPTSGKPFFYDTKEDGLTFRNYQLASIEIPEEHREFLQGRGSIFHAYTREFSYNDIFSVKIDELLDEFPDWDEVLESDDCDENRETWTEENHNRFKAALTWFSEQKQSFQATWCY